MQNHCDFCNGRPPRFSTARDASGVPTHWTPMLNIILIRGMTETIRVASSLTPQAYDENDVPSINNSTEAPSCAHVRITSHPVINSVEFISYIPAYVCVYR